MTLTLVVGAVVLLALGWLVRREALAQRERTAAWRRYREEVNRRPGLRGPDA